jgi:putative transposase
MIRGIERSPIFKDDQDRQDFISRTSILAQGTGTKIVAWALMNNHVHLLFFSGPSGISKFMRRLLTGYALRYNRRHRIWKLRGISINFQLRPHPGLPESLKF